MTRALLPSEYSLLAFYVYTFISLSLFCSQAAKRIGRLFLVILMIDQNELI
ncbi:MAG: hypothetical protein S4CHLAM45_15360 [Chlamydiales bacterium]|nr:hypothetical protein [Chlamydiales bacterium]MCH9620153.1 hypothetical protein [Chlamydiales bacterium]MCH9623623.1 hypothetical protein [Chlamydiales bacterium]